MMVKRRLLSLRAVHWLYTSSIPSLAGLRESYEPMLKYVEKKKGLIISKGNLDLKKKKKTRDEGSNCLTSTSIVPLW